MRHPGPGIVADKRYEFGRYTIRYLVQAGFTDLVALLQPVNEEVRAAHRAVQDCTGPVQDKRAERDFADSVLDESARMVRLQMSAVGVGADKKTPYTRVFPHGIDEYTKAKISEQKETYGRLCSRMADNLPPADPLVVSDIPRIRAELATWCSAIDTLGDVKGVLDLANGRLVTAVEVWERTMLEVYGILIGRVGKVRAERFFQKTSRKVEEEDEEAEAATTGAPDLRAVPPESEEEAA